MLSKLSQAPGLEEGAFLSLEVLGMCLKALHLGLWHLFCKDEEAPGWFSVIQLSGSISHGKVQGSRQELCVGLPAGRRVTGESLFMSGEGEPGLLLQDLSGSHSLPLAVETMPCNGDMSMRPGHPEQDKEAL